MKKIFLLTFFVFMCTYSLLPQEGNLNWENITQLLMYYYQQGDYENALLCLNHEKHVLCEKAFTINAVQAEELINLARNNKLFLMEAMWTRYIPAIVKLRKLLNKKISPSPF